MEREWAIDGEWGYEREIDHPERSLDKAHQRTLLLHICIVRACDTSPSRPTKISKHPQPARFFSTGSSVTDWYRGQLSEALGVINHVDISFVMYYAPWDAECQYVREEFEKAADMLHDRAVAVGYTPLTKNSRAYNIWYSVALKIRDFDTIGEICFATVTSEDLAADLGIESVPTVRFMLWNETKEYDDELEFGETALIDWLLRHFTQPVARIIPMWKKAFSFEPYVNGNPLLILFTPMNPLYEQLPVYDLLREISMEYQNCDPSKNQWVMEISKLQQIQRLLYQQKDFKKLCQDYETKKPLNKPIQKYFKKEVLQQYNKYPWHNATDKTHKNGLFGFLSRRSLSLSAALQGCGDEQSNIIFPISMMDECESKILPAEKSYYQDYEQCFEFEGKFNYEQESSDYYETTMLSQDDDPLSAESLLNDHIKHFCKLMEFAHDFGTPVFPVKENGNISHIQGLACAKNFSLNMIAVDSVRNHHFAEALGIDVMNIKDKTAVVILDSKNNFAKENIVTEEAVSEKNSLEHLSRNVILYLRDNLRTADRRYHSAVRRTADDPIAPTLASEQQYVLKEEYNAKSVRDFILNFTNNNLERSLRTDVKDAIHTHYYRTDVDTEVSDSDENNIEIIDLTTRTFRKFARKPDVVNIVLLCGGGCGSAWTRAALGAVRLLRAAGVRALLGRLDALRHDLPWHYTPHYYPTVLVFHTERIGRGDPDSASFPAWERVTAAGVTALALRCLRPPYHLRVRLVLCQKEQSTEVRQLDRHDTTLSQYRREVIVSAVAFCSLSESFGGSIPSIILQPPSISPLPSPLAHSFLHKISYSYEGGNSLVTPPMVVCGLVCLSLKL
ncbi:hypothetical protein EVAR_55649_1 [Eumeta japonica]|uniref:Thioredoxin domain-containing protein 11 n=1 Tax=Eumeta variegata TaxID=151549 RepID=A0A4C1XY44_EUMVA|nr:hypothetical protein EVAR_55649_1 [Eumeta japonica]